MSVTVIYEFQAADDKASDLLALLRRGRDLARSVEGCDGFDVYQAHGDPDRFVLVESWSSAEVHQAHLEKNVKATGVLDAAAALMARPPDLADAYYTHR